MYTGQDLRTVSTSSYIMHCFALHTVHVHDLIIIEMLRKKGKATQHNRKTKQYNTTCPRQLEKKLPRVGFEPTTIHLLGVACTRGMNECQSHLWYFSHCWCSLIPWSRALWSSSSSRCCFSLMLASHSCSISFLAWTRLLRSFFKSSLRLRREFMRTSCYMYVYISLGTL